MAENSLAQIEQKANGMMAQVEAVKVTTTEELSAVSDMVANIKKLAKFIKDEKEKFTAPAKAIIASAKEKYDPYLDQCAEAEQALKSKVSTFMLAQRKREEDERKKVLAKVETGYIKPETAMTKLANVEVAPKTATTANSSISMRMRKDVEIVDLALIPDEYYKPRELDMVKLRKVVTAGVEVPGTKLIEVPTMVSA